MKLYNKLLSLALFSSLCLIDTLQSQPLQLLPNEKAQTDLYQYIDLYFDQIEKPSDINDKLLENIKNTIRDAIIRRANINLGEPVYNKKGKLVGYGLPLLYRTIIEGHKKIVPVILRFGPDLTPIEYIDPKTMTTKYINLDEAIKKSGHQEAFKKAFDLYKEMQLLLSKKETVQGAKEMVNLWTKIQSILNNEK